MTDRRADVRFVKTMSNMEPDVRRVGTMSDPELESALRGEDPSLIHMFQWKYFSDALFLCGRVCPRSDHMKLVCALVLDRIRCNALDITLDQMWTTVISMLDRGDWPCASPRNVGVALAVVRHMVTQHSACVAVGGLEFPEYTFKRCLDISIKDNHHTLIEELLQFASFPCLATVVRNLVLDTIEFAWTMRNPMTPATESIAVLSKFIGFDCSLIARFRDASLAVTRASVSGSVEHDALNKLGEAYEALCMHPGGPEAVDEHLAVFMDYLPRDVQWVAQKQLREASQRAMEAKARWSDLRKGWVGMVASVSNSVAGAGAGVGVGVGVGVSGSGAGGSLKKTRLG